MKKKILILIIAAAVILTAYTVGSGFIKSASAYIADYFVSSDGTEMTVNIGVGSSVGYVRKIETRQQSDGRLCLDCYNAFGGFNGSIGTKEKYVIQLSDKSEIISVYEGKNSYKDVLQKDADGEWRRIK